MAASLTTLFASNTTTTMEIRRWTHVLAVCWAILDLLDGTCLAGAFVVVPTTVSVPRLATTTTTWASVPTARDATAKATDKNKEKDPEYCLARMDELNSLLDQAEAEIDEIDATMDLSTDDDYTCFELQRKKERLEKQMSKYFKELDELEEQLEAMGYSFEEEDDQE